MLHCRLLCLCFPCLNLPKHTPYDSPQILDSSVKYNGQLVSWDTLVRKLALCHTTEQPSPTSNHQIPLNSHEIPLKTHGASTGSCPGHEAQQHKLRPVMVCGRLSAEGLDGELNVPMQGADADGAGATSGGSRPGTLRPRRQATAMRPGALCSGTQGPIGLLCDRTNRQCRGKPQVCSTVLLPRAMLCAMQGRRAPPNYRWSRGEMLRRNASGTASGSEGCRGCHAKALCHAVLDSARAQCLKSAFGAQLSALATKRCSGHHGQRYYLRRGRHAQRNAPCSTMLNPKRLPPRSHYKACTAHVMRDRCVFKAGRSKSSYAVPNQPQPLWQSQRCSVPKPGTHRPGRGAVSRRLSAVATARAQRLKSMFWALLSAIPSWAMMAGTLCHG